MSKIRIVNWLLTRKCNLNCDYCGIVKNLDLSPNYYPRMSHYYKNEMPPERIIDALKNFKIHNSDAFHIFYGGEPLLYKDLHKIIKFCNENKIYYTIISNNTPKIQPLINKLINKVGTIEGFTSSVDPIFDEKNIGLDRVLKSIEGLKQLKEIQAKGIVKDVVAEITVMKHNVDSLEKLIGILSIENIYSDITFIDIAKNNFYDFSNIRDSNLLVDKTFTLAETLVNIYNNQEYLVHMKDILIPKIFDILPSNMDCEIEKGLHNITIDSDGSIRLCLRIRGNSTPKLTMLETLFDEKHEVCKWVLNLIKLDKKKYCNGCNHTCLIMSKYIDETEDGTEKLVHIDKRR